MYRYMLLFFFSLSFLNASSSPLISEKVLICGVCKDIEKATANTIKSIELLGAQFSEYHAIIYENNSKDKTAAILRKWAEANPHVTFISEHVRNRTFRAECHMKRGNRTEAIARARNIVLNQVMQERYQDYKYVIWADLDFREPWDIENIVDTILHPEQEWDAVLANGQYDLFAFRDAQFPLGPELLGNYWWSHIREVEAQVSFDRKGKWRPVYSAFGGLGIYKREALRGCHYSGVVTQDLENAILSWLEKAKQTKDVLFLKEYSEIIQALPLIELRKTHLRHRKNHPEEIALRLHNHLGLGKVIWLSCTGDHTLPNVCEHITLHASMAQRGHDKIFINPRLISTHSHSN